MGKYIKLFNSHLAYEDFIESEDFILPNVSRCELSKDTHYTLAPKELFNYLTFKALEDGTFKMAGNAVSYSIDNGQTWTSLASATNTPTISAGNEIMWKASGLSPNSNSGIGTFSSTGNFEVYGNIMSLVKGDDFYDSNAIVNCLFRGLFKNCTKLINAENLILPATILAEDCYYQMFYGCTSLATAPKLSALTLASSCYSYMFDGCTSLTIAPKLPAKTLANYCYMSMFYGCTSLTTAPVLLATTLADCCYTRMFFNCTSLTTAPTLPATTLYNQCYSYMFQGCTSLTTAPELPATTLAYYCYWYMFSDCTSLTIAPELSATTLANGCYADMFKGCTSLTTSPQLPATTLASYCYGNMFEDCINLTTTPELLASTLVNGCYLYMFKNCSKVNYMKADYLSDPGSASDFLINTAQLGTFIKNPNLSTLYIYSNSIVRHSTHTPPTWTIVSSFTVNTIDENGIFTTTPAFWTYPVRSNNTLHIILNNIEFVGTVTQSSDTYTYTGTSNDKTLNIKLVPNYGLSHIITSYSAQYTIQNMTLNANDVVNCSYYYDA